MRARDERCRIRRVAMAHCRTTRETIVRADGSTAHEGMFDLETGKFLRQTTHQGLRPDSAWARGLAWSLYGYSKVFGLTGEAEFLAVAERNADYWLAHFSQDNVSYWDFDADLSLPAPWGAKRDQRVPSRRAGCWIYRVKRKMLRRERNTTRQRLRCSMHSYSRNTWPIKRQAGKEF